MVTAVHTLEFTAGSAAEYQALLAQVATYVATGLNPGESVVSQQNHAGSRKITLKIQTTTAVV